MCPKQDNLLCKVKLNLGTKTSEAWHCSIVVNDSFIFLERYYPEFQEINRESQCDLTQSQSYQVGLHYISLISSRATSIWPNSCYFNDVRLKLTGIYLNLRFKWLAFHQQEHLLLAGSKRDWKIWKAINNQRITIQGRVPDRTITIINLASLCLK